MDIPDTDFEPYCTTYGHAPIAGMMHVSEEDLHAVAQARAINRQPRIACERCDQTYTAWVGWRA